MQKEEKISPSISSTPTRPTRASSWRRAVRAAARAIGSNCLALVIPCHRVVGSDGALTGYAGGVARKRWLLDHERGTR